MAEGEPPQHEMALGMLYARAVAARRRHARGAAAAGAADVPGCSRASTGLCLSGGPDLDPRPTARRAPAELGPTEPALDRFELALARGADARGLPILGICRGCQALNVARGGTLHQHLPDVTDGAIEHRQTAPGSSATHAVDVEPGRGWRRSSAPRAPSVNSFHHQAVDRLGAGLRAVAWAPDGVDRGARGSATRAFVLGVQWHAETLFDRPEHARLFEALIEAASASATRRAA